jgi:hypothetical protein
MNSSPGPAGLLTILLALSVACGGSSTPAPSPNADTSARPVSTEVDKQTRGPTLGAPAHPASSDGAARDNRVAEPAGAGGAGGATCENLDGTEFANLTAPTGEGEGYREAVIVATETEVALASLRHQASTRHYYGQVIVEVQRFTLAGAPIGAPILVKTYEQTRRPNGELTMATDGREFMLCWGEGDQIRCAAIEVGLGKLSLSSGIVGGGNASPVEPHVVHGASGWTLFFGSYGACRAVALRDNATAKLPPVWVPASIAVATNSGFAVVAPILGDNPAPDTSQVFRLGPNLKMLKHTIKVIGTARGIAAFGDTVSVVSDGNETRISPSNQLTVTPFAGSLGNQLTPMLLADSFGNQPVAVAPRKGSLGLAWHSTNEVVAFTEIDPVSHFGATLRVGCAEFFSNVSIAATAEGFLVSTRSLTDRSSTMYPLSRILRVRRIPRP